MAMLPAQSHACADQLTTASTYLAHALDNALSAALQPLNFRR